MLDMNMLNKPFGSMKVGLQFIPVKKENSIYLDESADFVCRLKGDRLKLKSFKMSDTFVRGMCHGIGNAIF